MQASSPPDRKDSRHSPVRGWLASMIAMALVPAWAWSDVYIYTDPQGVTHYTNAPQDGRYQRLVALMEPEAPRNRAGVPAPKGAAAAYAPLVDQVALEEGVDSALVHAVITAESGYNASAVSRAGAMGLMQLMPGTARRYAVKDAFDPEQNIRGGARYLRDLLQLFDNNLELAVAAYNAGENAVLKYDSRIPPYAETRAYVPKVMGLYRKLTRL